MAEAALWSGTAGVCAVVAGCGLAAGLYRGRFLRGSRDEVRAVTLAAFLAACCLAVAGLAVAPGRHAVPEVILGAALAVVAMLGARYVAFAAVLRSGPSAPAAAKVIVFGAGEAGSQLIRRLATQPGGAYRPVAILDDDPLKRRLRIHGVPVLGAAARWRKPPRAPAPACWSSRSPGGTAGSSANSPTRPSAAGSPRR